MRKAKHKRREHKRVLKSKSLLKGKSKGKKIALLLTSVLPILLSAAWLAVLVSPAKSSRFALSPARTAPLIIGLAIFMVGYVVFLSMMFSEDIKEVYGHLFKHKAN